jgi:hypothetical protein
MLYVVVRSPDRAKKGRLRAGDFAQSTSGFFFFPTVCTPTSFFCAPLLLSPMMNVGAAMSRLVTGGELP